MGMLFLLVLSAGCFEQSDIGTLTPSPTIPSIQAKFVKGDIIAKTASFADEFRIILKYDSLTGKYERASVFKKPDGRWYRNNEKSEFADRFLTEKIYPLKVGHVSSLSLVPVETFEPVPLATQEKNIPSIPVTLSTQSLLKMVPAAQFTASSLQGQAPLTVQFIDQSVSAGTSSYAWDINNDGVVDYTIKNPVHTYQTAGTFTVKLTVTNASGSDSEVKTGYITATSSAVIAGAGDFGAESNPTGNPIGGGAGYIRIISETDPQVKYVVSTADQLIAALGSAKSGEVVFIKGSAVIDMTANPAITIPAGVTLASDRGLNGSLGALIKRAKNVNGGWGEQIFIAGGDNVRLTGVRLEGEMYPQDYGNKAGETYHQQYLVGIYAKERTGYEVDNCELRGFAWSAVVSDNCVQSSVHHNYIHHNQARGEGYGVALYGGTSIIEANIFDYNRHSITGTGYAGEGYEARYNIVKGNGNAIGGHHFDVHQDERGGSFAGNLYKIHHNTFQDGNGKMASIAIRQRPVTGMYIDHNVFETISNATEGGVPIWERDSNQNMFVTNNYWNGTLYSDDEIVSYINQ